MHRDGRTDGRASSELGASGAKKITENVSRQSSVSTSSRGPWVVFTEVDEQEVGAYSDTSHTPGRSRTKDS